MASEFGFRPCKIEDLKGQPKVQKMLRIYIKAAQIKNESFPHTIITGQSGCGKTATANVIAHELGYGFKAFSGPAINDKKVIDEILLNLKDNDEVLNVYPMDNEKIGFLTSDGNCIIIETENISPIGRAAAGVKGIKLNDGAQVIDSQIIENQDKIFLTNLEKDLTREIKVESLDEYSVPGVIKIYGTYDIRTGE